VIQAEDVTKVVANTKVTTDNPDITDDPEEILKAMGLR